MGPVAGMEIEKTIRRFSKVMTRKILSDAAIRADHLYDNRAVTLCEILTLATSLSDRSLERLADIASRLAADGATDRYR
ncbi:MAG: hypothetical protein KF841_10555 [Phycisphaerae bacterium]|nr:hypothetical protein [Phycisphaerae bacterium]